MRLLQTSRYACPLLVPCVSDAPLVPCPSLTRRMRCCRLGSDKLLAAQRFFSAVGPDECACSRQWLAHNVHIASVGLAVCSRARDAPRPATTCAASTCAHRVVRWRLPAPHPQILKCWRVCGAACVLQHATDRDSLQLQPSVDTGTALLDAPICLSCAECVLATLAHQHSPIRQLCALCSGIRGKRHLSHGSGVGASSSLFTRPGLRCER